MNNAKKDEVTKLFKLKFLFDNLIIILIYYILSLIYILHFLN